MLCLAKKYLYSLADALHKIPSQNAVLGCPSQEIYHAGIKESISFLLPILRTLCDMGP